MTALPHKFGLPACLYPQHMIFILGPYFQLYKFELSLLNRFVQYTNTNLTGDAIYTQWNDATIN